jgi:O-antigen/teichoic acid export membrane protein
VSVQVNTLANVIGRVWVAALGVLLIPVYVKFLGVEAYALVGIHGTLHTIFGLLDLGLGAGLNRELARLSATGADEQERRDLLATFDLIGVVAGVLVAVIVYVLAPLIAYRWVNAHELEGPAIVNAIRLIGLIIGLQIPMGFYQGGINGLERQVLFNGIWIVVNTVRGIGAVLVLMFVASTVRAFFAWQLCVAALSFLVWGLTLHRLVDRGSGRGRARRALFDRVWRYSAGWLGNAVGTSLLGLTDKVVLSRVLTLKDFGYYTFASYGAHLLLNLIVSVSAAFFPRFNSTIARGDEPGLAAEYRRGNQLMATLLVPAAFMVLFFSPEILMVWTRDASLTASTAMLFAILAAGMTVFGLSHVPYTAALCHGMFRTGILMTIILAVIWVPAMVFVPIRYGVVGAAIVWALMNASRVAIVPLLHRQYIRGEGMIWLRQGLLAPVLVAGVICGTSRLVAPDFASSFTIVAYLTGTWLLTMAAVAAIEPTIRNRAAAALRAVAAGWGVTWISGT